VGQSDKLIYAMLRKEGSEKKAHRWGAPSMSMVREVMILPSEARSWRKLIPPLGQLPVTMLTV
jgi:hypothetical protein